MTAQGGPYSRFRRAIDRGQLLKALDAAGELKVVRLDDALDLCQLLASSEDPMFSKAASKWLARFSTERKATLGQVQLAAAAFGQLWDEPDSKLPLQVLRGLIGR